MTIDEYLASLEGGNDNGGKGDDDSLESLVEQINGQDDEDLDDVDLEDMLDEDADEDGGRQGEPERKPDSKSEPNANGQPKTEDANKPEDNTQKRVQTPEENAHFAEQRRQREAAIAEKALKNSQEYQIIQTLAQMSGKTPEQMMQELRMAQVQAELQRQNPGITPEQAQLAAPQVIAERQRAEQAEARLRETEEADIQLKFQQWESRMALETNTIKTNHPYITDEEITQARGYMLTVLKNPNVPLEQALYALHGPKILEEQKKLMRTEALAEISGRKGKGPLPPQGGSKSDTEVLTADERFAAKMLGISEKDYLKNKKNPT